MDFSNEKIVGRVIEIPNDDILPNRFQPRKYFDETETLELAESIKEHGILQPIVVRKIGDKYEIIAGERRYKANILAGNDSIPAIISNLDDKESSEIAVIENIQRQNLTPIEEAISYKRILDMGYITQEELAKKIGKSQSAIANKIRLLKLSDNVQDALMEKKISERHARSLLKLESLKQQDELLEKIISERLTVRKTDEEIKKMNDNMNVDNNINQINTNVTSPILESKPIVNESATMSSSPSNNISNNDINASLNSDIPIVNNTPPENNNVILNNDILNQSSVAQPPVSPIMEEPIQREPFTQENIFPNTSINDNSMRSDGISKNNQSSISSPTQDLIKQNSSINTIAENQTNPVTEEQSVIDMGVFQANPIASENSINLEPNLTQSNIPTEMPVSNSDEIISSTPISNFNDLETPHPITNNNIINESVIDSSLPSNNIPLSDNSMAINQTIENSINNNVVNSMNIENSPSVDVPSFMPEQPVETNNGMATPIVDLNQTSISESINNDIPLNNNINSSMNQSVDPIIVTNDDNQFDPIMPDKGPSEPTLDFKTIINLIRQCSETIEKCGYKIETEEYDLEGKYQVTFNIEKD